MDVKYLIGDAVSPASLSTMISAVGTEGSRLGVDTQTDLIDTLKKAQAFYLLGGRSSIGDELAKTAGTLEFEDSAGTLICDAFRESRTFGKNRTIVQIRGIYAFGWSQVGEDSFHLAYKLNVPGMNTTSEIALGLLGPILKDYWGLT